MRIVADVAAGVCALIFLAAALGKVDSWTQWSRLSAEMPGPAFLGRMLRVVLPAIEGMIVLLSVGWPIVGLAAGTVFLGMLAVAVSLLVRRLAGRECNCFGAIAPATISPRLAGRNVTLAILAAGGWYAARHENLPALTLPKIMLTVLLGTGALMLMQYRRLHQASRGQVTQAKEVT